MGSLIDYMGSFFIAALVLLMFVQLRLYSTNNSFRSDSELQLQQNAKTMAEIINYDFRKIGYECDSTAISIADSNRIRFYADMDRNGSVDIVEYVTDTTKTFGTENPEDIGLYRIVNSDTLGGPSLGLTKIRFSYYDQFQTVTNILENIKYVKVEMWVEATFRTENYLGQMEYPRTYWEMTINPRNI